MDPKPPDLFELPEALRAFLERAGFVGQLAVLRRVDGSALRPRDHAVLPILVRGWGEPTKPGEVMARDAFIRTADGGVDWSPEAKAVLARGKKAKAKKAPRKTSAKTKPRVKRAAAKRR